MQIPNSFNYPFGFVDVGEDLIMADDVIMPESSSYTNKRGKP
jgi:hypothetical protein